MTLLYLFLNFFIQRFYVVLRRLPLWIQFNNFSESAKVHSTGKYAVLK